MLLAESEPLWESTLLVEGPSSGCRHTVLVRVLRLKSASDPRLPSDAEKAVEALIAYREV